MNTQLSLSKEQLQQFDTEGYLLLKNQIPPQLLARLQEVSSQTVTSALNQHNDPGFLQQAAIISNKGRDFVMRVNNLLADTSALYLELLGASCVLDPVSSLIETPLPIFESMLIKNAGDDAPVLWHRDMLHERKDRVITFGIYLDASNKQDGALRVIPGSQNSSDHTREFIAKMEKGAVESMEVEVEPGDVIIHDVMIVHSSTPLYKHNRRRTVYFEFRSTVHLQHNPRFSDEWIQIHQRLMDSARKRCLEKELNGTTLPWSEDEKNLLKELYTLQDRIEPAEYAMTDFA
jgi:ectoine hydroxylase-related dioxygenase (phytanoyl-CoA dioxygenase family)